MNKPTPRTTGNLREFWEICKECNGLGKEPAKVKTATQEVTEWRPCGACKEGYRLERFERLFIQYEEVKE